MTRAGEQAEHFRWQAGWCASLGSPLYAHLLTQAAANIEAGGPVGRVLGDREAHQRSALGLRLMGSVHRLVLEGQAPDLAATYPSAGGKADPETAENAFLALVDERFADVEAGIDRRVQTNEVGRSTALVGGFLEVARATRLPLRVLEVGASAGLNLRWDHFRYEARGATWGPADSPVRLCSYNSDLPLPFDVHATVAERAGCDPDPVDAASDEGRLTLLSYVWPDQAHRIRLLRSALNVAAKVPVPLDKRSLVDWLPERIGPVPGLATVVFHSIVMQYLAKDDRYAFEAVVRQAGEEATADAPLAWLRLEPKGGEFHVRLNRWPGGDEHHMATATAHGQNVRWLGLPR
jgi:hypothetical protein